MFRSFPAGEIAIVFGSTGGIGAAVGERLQQAGGFADVIGFHRHSHPALELTDERSIINIAAQIAEMHRDVRLIFNATGVLQGGAAAPEKTWRQLSPEGLSQVFAVNAIGPALLMKHFLPLLSRSGKAVFATLSARVGSIGDNHLGGWYSYRASKAALNQLVRTAAIELARQRPEAVCLAIHPGTVDTPLSAPHRKQNLNVRSPSAVADLIVELLDTVTPARSGMFLDVFGNPIPW